MKQRSWARALDDWFTRLELIKAINQIRNARGTGNDGLPVEVEKYIYSEAMLDLLLEEFNMALASGKVKQDWKDVDISVLFKKGERESCDNYRGISLINHTGKILERMIQNRLLPFALREGLIPETQFGFLAGVGTADAQGLAAHVAQSAANQGVKTFRSFIDLTKAYDKVDREALWMILRRSGVPPHFLALIADMHTDAYASIKQGGARSKPFLLQRGLKQGSVFAPLLFNIFLGAILNGCEAEYKRGGGGFRPSELGMDIQWRAAARLHVAQPDLMPGMPDFLFTKLSYIAYADDLVMMARSAEALQHMMNVFVKVAESFGQEVAVKKTKVMVSERLTTDNPVRTPCVITVHGNVLENVDSFVYLGSSVSWNGSLDTEIKRRVQRMCAAFSRWRGVLENFDIDIKARLMIFQSVIVSNGLYGCEVWNASKDNFDTLEGTHFHLLRRTIGPQVAAASRTQVLEFLQQVAPTVKIFPLEALAMKRMLRYWGHVARMDPWNNMQAQGARSRPKATLYNAGTFPASIGSALTRALEEFAFPLQDWEMWAKSKKAWRALLDERIMTYTRARWFLAQQKLQKDRRLKTKRDLPSFEHLSDKLRTLEPHSRYFAVLVKYFQEGILDFHYEDPLEVLDLLSFAETDDSPDEFSFLEEVESYKTDPLRSSRSAKSIERMHRLSGNVLSLSYDDANADGWVAIGGVQSAVMVMSDGAVPPPGLVETAAHSDEFLNPDPYHNYYRSGKNVLLPKQRFSPQLDMASQLGKSRSALKRTREVVAAAQESGAKTDLSSVARLGAAGVQEQESASDALACAFLERMGEALFNRPSDVLPPVAAVPVAPICQHRHPKRAPVEEQLCVEIASGLTKAGAKRAAPTVGAKVLVCPSGQKRGRATFEHVVSYPNQNLSVKDRYRARNNARLRPQKGITLSENVSTDDLEQNSILNKGRASQDKYGGVEYPEWQRMQETEFWMGQDSTGRGKIEDDDGSEISDIEEVGEIEREYVLESGCHAEQQARGRFVDGSFFTTHAKNGRLEKETTTGSLSAGCGSSFNDFEEGGGVDLLVDADVGIYEDRGERSDEGDASDFEEVGVSCVMSRQEHYMDDQKEKRFEGTLDWLNYSGISCVESDGRAPESSRSRHSRRWASGADVFEFLPLGWRDGRRQGGGGAVYYDKRGGQGRWLTCQEQINDEDECERMEVVDCELVEVASEVERERLLVVEDLCGWPIDVEGNWDGRAAPDDGIGAVTGSEGTEATADIEWKEVRDTQTFSCSRKTIWEAYEIFVKKKQRRKRSILAQLKLLARIKVSCDVSDKEVELRPNRMQHEGEGEERMAVGCQPLTQAECVERGWMPDKCEMRCKDEGDDDELKQIVFEEVGALMCKSDGEEESTKFMTKVKSVEAGVFPVEKKQSRNAQRNAQRATSKQLFKRKAAGTTGS